MTSEPEGLVEPSPAPIPKVQPERRHLHPAATLIDAARIIRAALLPLLVVTFGQGILIGIGVTAAFIVIGGLVAFVNWRTEIYFVADGSLHHQTGLLRRREQVVPASRISALDTQRGIIQRAFGIVGVQVQTAGGGEKAELELRALTLADAEHLRLELGHRATTPHRATPDADLAAATSQAIAADDDRAPTFVSTHAITEDAPIVFQMTPRELLVAALTSPSIAVVGAAGAGLASFANDALPDSVATDLADRASDLSAVTILTFSAVIIVAAAVISIVGTALLYGGFRVTRDDRRLRVRRGILTERVGTVPLDRIHGVRVIESPLRQLLGYASIEVEVAGYAGQDEVTRTLVPLVRRHELPETLQRIVPNLSWPDAPLTGIPDRARRRYLTAPLVVAAIPAIALAAAPIGLARLLAPLPLLIAAAIGMAAARDAGWRRHDGMLTLRWRTFARHTVIAPEHRLQRASTAVNPFQRRASLANFAVRLSSAREASVKHLDAGVAHDLLGSALAHGTDH